MKITDQSNTQWELWHDITNHVGFWCVSSNTYTFKFTSKKKAIEFMKVLEHNH